jgi:ketosteroid isomerase-like protein
VIDDYGGKLYVFEGNEGYRTIWGPLVEEYMRRWKIGPDGEIKVKVGGDLAVSSFILIGGGTLKDGSAARLRQYCTFVWEKRDGQWKMSIEHISTDPEHST